MEYLTKCPYCGVAVILQNEEVCADCAPKFIIDLAIADVTSAIETLIAYYPLLSEERKVILRKLAEELERF